MGNNRAITVDGANRIFMVVGIFIEQHSLGHYQATFADGKTLAEKTLTGLCQEILKKISPALAKQEAIQQNAVSNEAEIV